MKDSPLAGRVALVTGGGGGIGRAHALALASYGAKIVVNDFGGSMDGRGSDLSASDGVVAEIRHGGGEAVANHGDVGVWSDAEAMIRLAIDQFGALDILVNNAGILRPKTIIGMEEKDVTATLRVHLVGSFATTHFAALHWRQRSKEGNRTGSRLINTTSGAGLFGFAQANYAAAKAGVAALTAVAATELAQYGVTANAVAPIAQTRMSGGIAPETHTADHAAELVCWLASDEAASVTGHVFNVGGGHISIVDRWHTGPSVNRAGLWLSQELGPVIKNLISDAKPIPDFYGYYPDEPRSDLLPAIELPRPRAAASQQIGMKNA